MPGKVASALDAPLTEAQIATLPPALQAVLRKKQAEQGAPVQTSAPAPLAPQMSPGVSSGVPPLPPGLSPGVSMDASASSSLPLEPVAPAADDLTPEQRAVLAQIRASAGNNQSFVKAVSKRRQDNTGVAQVPERFCKTLKDLKAPD